MRGNIAVDGVRFYVQVDTPERIDVHSSGKPVRIPGTDLGLTVYGSFVRAEDGTWTPNLQLHPSRRDQGQPSEQDRLHVIEVARHAAFTWARQKGALTEAARGHLANARTRQRTYQASVAEAQAVTPQMREQAATRNVEIDNEMAQLQNQIQALQTQIGLLRTERVRNMRTLGAQHGPDRYQRQLDQANAEVAKYEALLAGSDLPVTDLPTQQATPARTPVLVGVAGLGLDEL